LLFSTTNINEQVKEHCIDLDTKTKINQCCSTRNTFH